MDQAIACQCESGFCSVRNRLLPESMRAQCAAGRSEIIDGFLKHLDDAKAKREAERKQKPVATRIKHTKPERVGTALKTRIENLITIKTGKGCGCQNLATQMDSWGIAGCELRRDEILNHLVSNREILAAALTANNNWLIAAGVALAPDAAVRFGAGWLLDAAIQDVRNQPKPVRVAKASPNNGARKFLGQLKAEQDRLYNENLQHPAPQPDPFIGEPILHFGAHLWPTKGTWQWHVNLWNQMPRLINGKCFVGIAVDGNTDTFEDVRAALHPDIICQRFVNEKEGENQTFRWLQEVIPGGQDDVLIYCHGKGAKANTSQSEAVRRWSEAMYQTVVFNHDMIREKMAAGYINVHSFRTFGTRPLSPKYKYHGSGTFFAVRAKYLSGRLVTSRYGGVEAWIGEHFPASESWCEFYDNSMFTTLYDHNASREIVLPALTEWHRKQNYERGKH